jgi:hypothetical protein
MLERRQPGGDLGIRVLSINRPRETDPEGINHELHRQGRELETIAALYVEAEGNLEMLTTANDRLLRLFLRSGVNRESSDAFFARLGRSISQKEASKGRTGEDQKARNEAGLIRKSIEQLAAFVVSESAKNPDVFFATSPELDETRGIDLIKSEAVWDSKTNLLVLKIECVQAKAAFLTPFEIRRMAEEYQDRIGDLIRDFRFSRKWFDNFIKGIESAGPQLSESEVLDLLTREADLSDRLSDREIIGTKLESIKRFLRAISLFQQVEAIAAVLGEANPLSQPELMVEKPVFCFLVKTARGSEYLTLEQALVYK